MSPETLLEYLTRLLLFGPTFTREQWKEAYDALEAEGKSPGATKAPGYVDGSEEGNTFYLTPKALEIIRKGNDHEQIYAYAEIATSENGFTRAPNVVPLLRPSDVGQTGVEGTSNTDSPDQWA